MKNIIVAIFILIVTPKILTAQQCEFLNYIFNDEKVEIPLAYINESEVVLDRNIKVELLSKKEGAIQYYLFHEKIWINSDEAVERNNKVYLPFRIDEKVVKNKLRVIQKNGNIIELKSNEIKEEVDEEKGIKYNYFAVTGLEKGSIIEKIFILEEQPELKGKTVNLQSEKPIVNASFELIFPEHLVFKFKSYNNLSDAVFKEKTYEGKNSITIQEKNIDGLVDDEKYSNWVKHIKKFRYKLEANNYNGAKNLFSYKEFSKNVYENLFVEFDKKDVKLITEFSKTIEKSLKIEEQIWNIENKIKKTFTVNEYFEGNQTLTALFKNKQANEVEIARLYIALFKIFNIEVQPVITSKRFEKIFDKDFETTEQLKDLIFYFPQLKQFLEPGSLEYRFPLFNFNYGNNYGLFIKEKIFGGVKMGIGEIEKINIPDVSITEDKMDITIDFSKDIENPTIKSIISYNGYSALNFQTIKDFVDEKQYLEILKDIAKNYTYNNEDTKIKTINDGLEYVGKKPFILELEFNGNDLIQKAGETYLFKIGETIGKQLEFYQEEKRKLPIEIYYPHRYLRELKIILPKNYFINNLSDVKLDFKLNEENTTIAQFFSDYKIKENIIIISNNEFYLNIDYPLHLFEDYKRVINAAADFNKINLILKKN